MDVTEKEAFKLGFLKRCAEEQLTGEALNARVKAASSFIKSALELPSMADSWNALGNVAYTPLMLATVGGGLAGHLAGKLTEPDVDEEDLKARELAAAYKAYAARAKTNKKLRLYRPER
ncbi:hypothetical protein EBZ80_26315 [bacterium]|nr:hypothetical protein [Betaproteobacteria bacterium]NDE18428.1 hypothetical protein [bacterium]